MLITEYDEVKVSVSADLIWAFLVLRSDALTLILLFCLLFRLIAGRRQALDLDDGKVLSLPLLHLLDIAFSYSLIVNSWQSSHDLFYDDGNWTALFPVLLNCWSV